MLPEWAGWAGLVLTVIFGGLNVFQLVETLLAKGKMDCAAAQIEALRTMCEEAVANEEIINTPPVKQFVRSIAFQLGGIERSMKGTKVKFPAPNT